MPEGGGCQVNGHRGRCDLPRGNGVSMKLHSVRDKEEACTAEHAELDQFFGRNGRQRDFLSEQPYGLCERKRVWKL